MELFVPFPFLFFFEWFSFLIIQTLGSFLSHSQGFAQYLCGVCGRGCKKIFCLRTSAGVLFNLVCVDLYSWPLCSPWLAHPRPVWRRHGTYEPACPCGGELQEHAFPHHAQPHQCHPQHLHRGKWGASRQSRVQQPRAAMTGFVVSMPTCTKLRLLQDPVAGSWRGAWGAQV